jgi:hypothetical protein
LLYLQRVKAATISQMAMSVGLTPDKIDTVLIDLRRMGMVEVAPTSIGHYTGVHTLTPHGQNRLSNCLDKEVHLKT